MGKLVRYTIIALIACSVLLYSPGAFASTFYMLLGSRVVGFDHLPVILNNNRQYVSLAVLNELGLAPAAGAEFQDEQPVTHYDTDEGSGADLPDDTRTAAQTIDLAEPPASISACPPGYRRYRLASYTVDVSPDGRDPDVRINGGAVEPELLEVYGGRPYIAAESLDGVGLHLAFNAGEDLYQLVGLIHEVVYEKNPPAVVLRCLTPLSVEPEKSSGESLTLGVEGGFLNDVARREFDGDPHVDRIGFKTQPDLGRSFVFIHQPRQTGYKIRSEDKIGYARISFGNYLQVGQPRKSSSGEISVAVDLAVSSDAVIDYVDGPPRVFVDFTGVKYDEATIDKAVDIGRVDRMRVGQPEPGKVRVVLELSERADYRLLANSTKTRYYIQLLPPAPKPSIQPEVRINPQLRKGRVVMIDPGHGGSDPGAPGVVDGVWEKDVVLPVSELVVRELEVMGYQVQMTRSDDRFVSLGARSDLANRELPYVFVSIHANWMESQDFVGAMTFHHPSSSRGPKLAEMIQQEILSATGANDKGVRQANYFVLRETVMPSALVECGFLSNPGECRKLTDPPYQQKVARGIARGIDMYITGGW